MEQRHISRNRDGDTPAESATFGKSFGEGCCSGVGDGSPAEVRQCSRKRGEPRIRSFRGTSKETRGTVVVKFQ